MTIQRKACCLACGKVFTYTVKNPSRPKRTVCSATCRAKRGSMGQQAARPQELTPGEVDRILSEAVRMETAPAWVRHPVAWD